MSGIWSETGGAWRPLAPVGFGQEQELHDLIQRNPGMLPLAGTPRLAVLGREVRCGPGRADLVAVEVDTGVPVVIEIKLASNTDRRLVLTQVLGYAAHLRRLDLAGLEATLASHLGAGSIGSAVRDALQDPSLDEASLRARLGESLAAERLRCVIVIDAVPGDLAELVGYLQDMTSDRLNIDLVTVTAYDVGERRVLVPQLVEPDRQLLPPPALATARASVISKGPEVFARAVEESPPEHRPGLLRLLDWALGLEADGLAVLYSSQGRGRWVLNPRLPGQERGLVTVWNEGGASLSPYRTVLAQEAPESLGALDRHLPGQIKQGNSLRAEYDGTLLSLFRDAYEEAARSRSRSP